MRDAGWRAVVAWSILGVAAACTSARDATRTGAAPRTAGGAPGAELAARIDALCALQVPAGAPGFVVGVVRDGELVFARGFGLANLEHEIALTPSSVLDIGSTAKQFTAACIGLLVEDGALSLDDDVREWIPELPDYGETITLAHLLHHTSGLRDYLDLFALAGRQTEDWTTREQALAMIVRQKALNFSPGSEHSYSNSGYFLLSIVIERASGSSLAELARARIFEPLGMRDTRFQVDHRRPIALRASGYAPAGPGEYGVAASDYEQVGDGGLWTTVEDLARWDRNFETREVGGEALQRFLHARGRLDGGRELDYAAGLAVDRFRGLERVSHGGGWAGYRAQLMRFPSERCSVICLANVVTVDPSAICIEVASLLLADRFDDAPRPSRPPPGDARDAEERWRPTADELADFAGLYWSDELEVRAEVVARAAGLAIGEVGLATFELPPLARDVFGYPGIEFAFERGAGGEILGLVASTGRTRGVRFAPVQR